jgi:hypothetical protein
VVTARLHHPELVLTHDLSAAIEDAQQPHVTSRWYVSSRFPSTNARICAHESSASSDGAIAGSGLVGHVRRRVGAL